MYVFEKSFVLIIQSFLNILWNFFCEALIIWLVVREYLALADYHQQRIQN